MSDNTEKREVNMNRKEIKEIRLTECRAFEGNPFAVRDDAEMEMLKDSIRESGVLTPITVRAVPDGYEIVSGHRRVHACLSVAGGHCIGGFQPSAGGTASVRKGFCLSDEAGCNATSGKGRNMCTDWAQVA